MKTEKATVKTGGLYTVQEAADVTGTTASVIYGVINAGLLPAMKLGRMKIRPAALESFLETWEGFDLTDPKNPTRFVGE